MDELRLQFGKSPGLFAIAIIIAIIVATLMLLGLSVAGTTSVTELEIKSEIVGNCRKLTSRTGF